MSTTFPDRPSPGRAAAAASPRPLSRRRRLALLVVGAIAAAGSYASETAEAPAADASSPGPESDAPRDYIRFEEKLDGKCYILSNRGKLVVMHNEHPTRPIRYRLIRMFSDRPQAGRATGVLEAGEEPRKLGCSEVDGRRQQWTIERAEWADTNDS